MTTAKVHPTSRIRHPLADGCPPEWASAWGQDAYGIFAEISLPAGDDRVTQRMRWIPPGRFLMGSPDDEPGRYPDETQHEVTISHGLWIFDTPTTQALWQAVMGDNPSRFVDPQRPVEQVSWDDTQAFLARLKSAVPGLALRLLTEAEWEYACRAGKKNDATYAGPIEIRGENNAPILHEIAWYGGNSGVDFDLDNGWDSSGWPKKHFDHKMAGTRKVAQKQPNRWGLYDMLGNVLEWCQDWFGDFMADPQIDPPGPSQGGDRVLRGGAWDAGSRHVRSACRDNYDPSYRDDDFGFRCAQAQES